MANPAASSRYHIQPYHMNGLNWRLMPGERENNRITVITGFMPAWWEKEYGITFGTPFHTDGEIHRSTLIRMNALLKERFGDLGDAFVFEGDYEHTYPCERRYGDAFIPALFGATVNFDDASGHPFAECLRLDDEEVEKLEVPDLENHPVVTSLFDPNKGGFSDVSGEIGNEGVINIAHKLRGEQMFFDMIERPDLFNHLCDVIYDTIDGVMHLIRRWQAPEKPAHVVVCDCLINMISNDMYRELLLRYEKQFAKSFDLFGIHTCNWKVDPYLESLADLGNNLHYLDMGAESDFDKIHTLFPDLQPSVFYHPERVRHFSHEKIRREIDDLCKKIDRGYILLSDLEEGTPDSSIRLIYETASKY